MSQELSNAEAGLRNPLERYEATKSFAPFSFNHDHLLSETAD